MLAPTPISSKQSDKTQQAYNSIFNQDSSSATSQVIGNFPLLPLRTRVRGPAYTLPLDGSLPAHLSPEPDSESYDTLDEVLSLFRANTFFRNFEIQGPADRLMIYGILWVSECLGKIRPSMSGRYVCDDLLQGRGLMGWD
jgi:actin related protein 2/3 complex subunit 3